MSLKPIQVAVVGAAGRMGREALRALSADPNFEISAAVVREALGRGLKDLVGGEVPEIVLEEFLDAALDRGATDVVLDLSRAPAALPTAREALKRRIPLVSGVTGISDGILAEIRALAESNATPVLIVPNFSIGAVLAMRFAEIAAKWMPDAEIIELHHELKVDAPSGTAMLTAQRIGAARTLPTTVPPTTTLKAAGARGAVVAGVPVHSVRLPGLLAHQEILFGAPGEILTIRHDAADRTVYMPGVKLCLGRVRELSGLTVGMERLLFPD